MQDRLGRRACRVASAEHSESSCWMMSVAVCESEAILLSCIANRLSTGAITSCATRWLVGIILVTGFRNSGNKHTYGGVFVLAVRG